MKDEGCPTCGSKNFGKLGMEKRMRKTLWKTQCYSCKKFWFSET